MAGWICLCIGKEKQYSKVGFRVCPSNILYSTSGPPVKIHEWASFCLQQLPQPHPIWPPVHHPLLYPARKNAAVSYRVRCHWAQLHGCAVWVQAIKVWLPRKSICSTISFH